MRGLPGLREGPATCAARREPAVEPHGLRYTHVRMTGPAKSELRDRAKAFFNALDLDKPVSFGLDDLTPGLPASEYVEGIHGESGAPDPIEELATQIEFSVSAGAYLFTGSRGAGKTTELLRLARRLRDAGHEVFYADMADFLPLTQRIELVEFLVAVLGAFSESARKRFGATPVAPKSFFDRVRALLAARVDLQQLGLKIPLPGTDVEFKAALRQDPEFTTRLRDGGRSLVPELVRQAREYAAESVEAIRRFRAQPERRVVLLVDSVERISGGGTAEQIADVFRSVETLFNNSASELRFPALDVVYTVPPYLSALTGGGLTSQYNGDRLYFLPSLHIYKGCPVEEEWPETSSVGTSKMLAIVERRYSGWREFFEQHQVERLAESAGGDLRDFLRMLRLAIVRAMAVGVPVPNDAIADAESAVRNDMMPITDDDLAWLVKIANTHRAELPNLDRLPDFARLQSKKYVLQYRNSADWYAVHPLLRREIERARARR